MAGPTVSVLGAQPFDVLRHHYARCRALVFPGEEDFGIVPLEAMASGRPVVAFGRGGATETVVDGVTGTFFHDQTVEALLDAVERCEAMRLDPRDCVAHAAGFDKARFIAEMGAFIDGVLAQHGAGRPALPRVPRAEPRHERMSA
jgi:glycosyltransferase involved in cell wall biosynthesis